MLNISIGYSYVNYIKSDEHFYFSAECDLYSHVLMTEDLCIVSNTKFVRLSSQANGGVFCVVQPIELQVFRCFFVLCSTSQSNLGGCIYFESSKSLITFGNCVSECSSKSGFFIYIEGASKANFFLNETMATKCSGDYHAICFVVKSDLYSRMYNSSFCSSKYEQNIYARYNEISDSMFHQYYRNNQDIVYGIDADGINHRLSHSCLIMNQISNGNYGYIYTYQYPNEVLTVDNLYAYGNDKRIPIAYPRSGTIFFNNFTGDILNYAGNGQISTSNINIDTSFVMTSLFNNVLVCEKSTKCIYKTNRCTNHISIFFNLLLHLILE